MKRRKLEVNQEVVLIYVSDIGYVNIRALCTGYRRIMAGEANHEVPVFRYGSKEVTGAECFWLLPEDAKKGIEQVQKQLAQLQLQATTLAKEMDYKMPDKVKDPAIEKMAAENVERLNAVIEKFGFDPRDETWLEEELAEGDREKNWFKFERENGLVFSQNWDDVVQVYNQQFKDNIVVSQAKNMSKKRMRYWLGAHYTRMSGNNRVDDWKQAARNFEKAHRARENRMLSWSLLHRGKFPLVRTKEELPFWPGPYFHRILERLPHLFTDATIQKLKPGTILRVLSYDTQDKYIRLDFTEDTRKEIKPDEPENTKIWVKDSADYDFWIKPEEVESHLEILESLE